MFNSEFDGDFGNKIRFLSKFSVLALGMGGGVVHTYVTPGILPIVTGSALHFVTGLTPLQVLSNVISGAYVQLRLFYCSAHLLLYGLRSNHYLFGGGWSGEL